MDKIEREFDYGPNWGLILLSIGGYSAAAALSGYMAETNDRGMVVLHTLHLSPEATTVTYLIACAIFVICAALPAVRIYERLTVWQRVAFKTDSLLVPAARWSSEEVEIAYRDIGKWEVVEEDKYKVLVIRHPGGKHTIKAVLLPSPGSFKQVCKLLAAKVIDAQGGDPLAEAS